MHLRRPGQHRAGPGLQVGVDVAVVGAGLAQQFRGVGDDVARRATVDPAHRHPRLVPGHPRHALQRERGRRRAEQGVAAVLRGEGGVRGPAAEHRPQLGVRQQPVGRRGEGAGGQRQSEVHGHEQVDVVGQARRGHRAAAPATLLGGLEEDRDGSRRRVRGEASGELHGHADVTVVAAGVHLARVGRGEPVAVRPVARARRLADREGVHVGAQPDVGAGPPAQGRDHGGVAAAHRGQEPRVGPGGLGAGVGGVEHGVGGDAESFLRHHRRGPGDHLPAEVGQRPGHAAGGAELGEPHLGVGVQVPAPGLSGVHRPM